jgi:dihydropyrimidinase
MKPPLLIKNGTIVNASGSFSGDILIEGNKISHVGPTIIVPENALIIDASDKFIFPGAIDAHVHLELPTPAGPSSDDFYSGSKAAIAGGTTTIIDFVTPAKGESLISALNKRKAEATKSLIDYSLHMGVTWWDDTVKEEVQRCVREEGVTSFKTYLAYKGTVGIEEAELYKLMQTVAPLNALVTVHCEKGEIVEQNRKDFVASGKTSPVWHARSRPPEAESESVKAVLQMAEKTKCPVYIVHTSTAESVQLIRDAQKRGVKVFSETCPQYLLLDESVYEKPLYEALAYIISPPIRSREHQKALWDALKDGTISVIATDHCPFNTHGQKDVGAADFTKVPNGAGGIENRLELMNTFGVKTGKISLEKFVALNAENPAKIFGLYPGKGVISEGSDADIVIWNKITHKIISAKTQQQHCDSNIYEGFEVSGSPETVIVNGEIVFQNNRFSDVINQGRFLKR